LIEGTLDIARIESGKLTLDIKPMDFADAVHELAAMFELQAAAKGLHFEFEVSGALPELVRADDKRVRQIIINLLGNAIKFTSQGQVTLRVRYAREMAFIDIADTGPGMSPEQITQVFEPFTRGAATGTGQGGAGLGLTIAKMLTDLMGGALSVDSTPGVGSVFHVKLFVPEVLSSGVRYKVPAATPGARRGYSGARRHVLIVDNEDVDREVLSHLLLPLGFVLRTAASGHDALDLLAAGYRPDVIFMDLAMPGIDGWETIRRLRAMPRMDKVQVAVVSANAFDKALENDVGISPQDFITKPVRHAELLDWLAQRLKLEWLYTEPSHLLPAENSASTASEPGMPTADTPTSVAPTSDTKPPAKTPALISTTHETHATNLPVHLSAHALQAMRDAISLGYLRGVLNQLDQIRQTQPHAIAWTNKVEALARSYEFESITPLLGDAHMKVKP
jgi:CheY-like chemotaxis protein